MPRPRFLRADATLQQALLDAAARELAAHGYAGASLNAILLAAGLSKGAFYYYFDDKADLAAAVLEREIRQWDLSELPRGNTVEEFWAHLESFSQQSMAKLRESPERSDLITRLGSAMPNEPALQERCAPLIASMQAQVGAFWQHGQELGAVRTDLPVAAVVAVTQAAKTALASALLPADRGATPDEILAFTRVYFDLLRRIVEPRPREDDR
jgi:AcrR family transcriptional regulator